MKKVLGVVLYLAVCAGIMWLLIEWGTAHWRPHEPTPPASNVRP